MLVIFITGCVSTRPVVQVDPQIQINSWDMMGRLAATVGRDGGSATFIWNKQPDQHKIELFGPLGSGRVFLSQVEGKATIEDKDAKVSGDNLEQVLFETIGWLVPFDAINFWVAGKPQPNTLVKNQKYENDNLISFEQSGWQVNYNRFERFDELAIPAKISIMATPDYLTQLSADLKKDISKVSVKLIIKEFSGS